MDSTFVRWVIVCVFVSIMGCDLPNQPVSIAFYHWKSVYKPTPSENEWLSSLQVDKLYVRYFDVVSRNGHPMPTSNIQFVTNPTQEIVPTIFIVHQTLIGLSKEEIKDLAHKIANRINSKHAHEIEPKAVQLDCDWTQSSRENFFLLCQELKSYFPEVYSTIRLHQFRYPEKTGVPPVDKGIVMCYATEDPFADTENSILDLDLLAQYLDESNNYPLKKVDFALPIYSWGVVQNHLGKHKLINGLSEKDLQDSTLFLPISKNRFEVQKNTFLEGNQLSKGFQIRLETITPDRLQKAKKLLAQKINSPYQLIYYHLDDRFLQRFQKTDLQ